MYYRMNYTCMSLKAGKAIERSVLVTDKILGYELINKWNTQQPENWLYVVQEIFEIDYYESIEENKGLDIYHSLHEIEFAKEAPSSYSRSYK